MAQGDASEILRHSLRSRILGAIVEQGEASPADIAATLGAPLGNVSYHVKVLSDAGWIAPVRTERRGGGLRHVYCVEVPPFIDDDEWTALPLALRRGLANQTLREVMHTAALALRSGGFDEFGDHIDQMTLRLDREGIDELSLLLKDTLARAAEIQRRSVARRRPDARPSRLAVLHYRPPPAD
jgi:DNA-binding transcriptional ArsR family regulator